MEVELSAGINVWFAIGLRHAGWLGAEQDRAYLEWVCQSKRAISVGAGIIANTTMRDNPQIPRARKTCGIREPPPGRPDGREMAGSIPSEGKAGRRV